MMDQNWDITTACRKSPELIPIFHFLPAPFRLKNYGRFHEILYVEISGCIRIQSTIHQFRPAKRHMDPAISP
jgi:hypothetical protein